MLKIISVLLAILLGFLEKSRRELRSFRLQRYEILVPKLPNKKIIFLSDFHDASMGERCRKLWKEIEKEKPDVILIGGDMLITKYGIPSPKTMQFLKGLRKIAPVFYANGNHEQRLKEYTERYQGVYSAYKKELVEDGIVFLENARVVVPDTDEKIYLSGMEIPYWGYHKVKKKEVTLSHIQNLVDRKEKGEYEILLAHHPKYMKTYWEWGADLVLSGHYHGGMIQIPFLGGLISPDFRLFPPFFGGMFSSETGQKGIVSRGLGMHTIKFRLWNPPEVVVIELGEGKIE